MDCNPLRGKGLARSAPPWRLNISWRFWFLIPNLNPPRSGLRLGLGAGLILQFEEHLGDIANDDRRGGVIRNEAGAAASPMVVLGVNDLR